MGTSMGVGGMCGALVLALAPGFGGCMDGSGSRGEEEIQARNWGKDAGPDGKHGVPDGGVVGDAGAGTGATPFKVVVAPRSVDVVVAGQTLTFLVPVPTVELELVEGDASDVPRRTLTPVVEVEIPAEPARRARVPVEEIDPPVCTPGTARRVGVPVVDVTLPDTTGDAIPTRVRVPVVDVSLIPGEVTTFVPTRVRVPALTQDLPTGCFPTGTPTRVRTPAIDVGLVDPTIVDLPTRVRVPVPEDQADVARRAQVPVSPSP